MNYGIIAFLFGLGSGAWIYSKVSHRNGNNYKSSLTVSGVSGLIIAFVVYTLMRTYFR